MTRSAVRNVFAQFPPRLLLTGAVLTALTASTGTVVAFPGAAPQAPALPAPAAVRPPQAPAPATPPPADGAQIAELAAGPAPVAPPVPAPGDAPVPAPGDAPVPAPGDAPAPAPGDAPAPAPGDAPAPVPAPAPPTEEDISTTPGEPSGEAMSEAEWQRLPPGLRERVRTACASGELKSPHCKTA